VVDAYCGWDLYLLCLHGSPAYARNGVLSTFPELAAVQETLAFRLLLDTWLMFAMEIGVIGLMLIVSSRAPAQAMGLVYTVLALEVVRGILIDLYAIVNGSPPGFTLHSSPSIP
jgi:hypothetical protein